MARSRARGLALLIACVAFCLALPSVSEALRKTGLALHQVPGESSAESAAEDGGQDEEPQDHGLEELGLPLNPSLPGLEGDGLALRERMDEFLDEAFPQTGVPGLAVAVVSGDGVLFERTMGDCTGADSSFIIGSLSKSITAAAIMQQVERGRMDLDAPVTSYLPECGQPQDVTLRSLLNQTSGFGYYDSLASAKPGASSGSFSYSNANYDLLGCALEAVTGQSYADYLCGSLFEPLGMNDASVDPKLVGASTRGHRNWFGLNLQDGYVHRDGPDAWGGPSSGYVRASLSDMEGYLRMYLQGGAGVLSSSSVRSMTALRVPDPQGESYYGLGWTTFHWDDGELVMSHDGQVENYVARMVVLPARGLALVVLGDASDYLGGNEAFWNLADGVTAISVGADADAGLVDSGHRVGEHLAHDGVYLLMLGSSLWGVVSWRRWLRRLGDSRAAGRARDLVVPALVAHGLAPACLLWVPSLYGAPWRDFATFVPDAALVLLLTVGLLALGGLLRLGGACTLTPWAKPQVG